MAHRGVNTNALSTHTSTEDTSTFNFFGLPRELRDSTYEYMCSSNKKEDIGTHHHLEFQIRGVPAKCLFLVCRQLKDELEEATVKSMSLLGTDRDRREGYVLNPSHRLLKVSSIELHLAASWFQDRHNGLYCRMQEELVMHGNTLMTILPKFQCLRAVSLNFHVSPHSHVRECEREFEEHLPELLSGLLAVRIQLTINVFQQHFKHDHEKRWDFSREMTLSMTNCNESGELRRVITKGDQEPGLAESS